MNSQYRIQPGVLRFVAEGSAHDSARSLDLLRDIEMTVEVNDILTEQFETITGRNKHATEVICTKTPADMGDALDRDGSVQGLLDRTLSVLEQLQDHIQAKRQSAIEDQQLRTDDGVVESFDKVIDSIRDAHEATNELIWAVLEHDADCSPLSGKGPFTSVDDLLAAIRS